jgi:5-methylcytosine-specific restriction protein A
MPYLAKHPCNHVGCRELTNDRFCAEHQTAYTLAKDRQRGSAHQRGYTKQWSKASKQFLRDNPLCVHCKDEGLIRAATEVDHIIAHKGDQLLFWLPDNLQALCKPCHSRKTIKEDGGFGNDKS